MSNTLVLADPTVPCEDTTAPLRAEATVERTFRLERPRDGVEPGAVDRAGASAVAASLTPTLSAIDEITESFDSIACLDSRVRQTGRPVKPVAPGRYIEIRGADRTLLVELGREVTHIGRGLAADLHLDDSSVSRRHALLVPLSCGHRILDDRSFNGTFVNGQRIEQTDLHNGDVIMLGRVKLRYLEYAPGAVADTPNLEGKPAPTEVLVLAGAHDDRGLRRSATSLR